MGHKDERDAEAFLKLFELHSHLDAQFGIQGAERFVEQEHLGLADDRPREGDPLALAARHLRRLALHKLAQRGHLHHAVHTLFDLGSRNFFHPESESDVFKNGEVWKQGVALEDLIHIAPVRRIKSHVLSAD